MAEQKKTDVRALAHSALLMINEEGSLSHIVMREALDKYAFLNVRDKAFFYRLVKGTLEYQNRIDSIIDSFSKVKSAKMKPYIRNLVRMGLYQILYMDKIPDSAACNEAVRLVRGSAFRGLSGFVNGLLRNISRSKDSLRPKTREDRYSVKKWMLDELDASIGAEAADRFLESTLREHRIYVRAQDTEAAAGLASLHQLHIQAAGIEISDMYCSDDPENLQKTKLWQDGDAFIQDISSSMPVRMSRITQGMTVIDVCAAPGGKSVQAAQRMNKTGRVIACDISDKKASLIRENAVRTGCGCIEVMVQDALERRKELTELADVVIADLPCSGIGTISHKPDIKNRLTYEDVLSLAKLQKDILNNVCEYVKPGGQLIYSTCTLTKEENAENVEAFINGHGEFSIKQCVTMLPCREYDCDGFFVCVMERDDNDAI